MIVKVSIPKTNLSLIQIDENTAAKIEVLPFPWLSKTTRYLRKDCNIFILNY